jgi:hypothetical protein
VAIAALKGEMYPMNQSDHVAVTRESVRELFDPKQGLIDANHCVRGMTESQYFKAVNDAQAKQDHFPGPSQAPASWVPGVQKEHALADPHLSGPENLARIEKFVIDELALAREAALGPKGIHSPEVEVHLGKAGHAIEDSYSDAHIFRGDAVHSGDPMAPIESINVFAWLGGTHDHRLETVQVHGQVVTGNGIAAAKAYAMVLTAFEKSLKDDHGISFEELRHLVESLHRPVDSGVKVNLHHGDPAWKHERDQRLDIDRWQLHNPLTLDPHVTSAPGGAAGHTLPGSQHKLHFDPDLLEAHPPSVQGTLPTHQPNSPSGSADGTLRLAPPSLGDSLHHTDVTDSIHQHLTLNPDLMSAPTPPVSTAHPLPGFQDSHLQLTADKAVGPAAQTGDDPSEQHDPREPVGLEPTHQLTLDPAHHLTHQSTLDQAQQPSLDPTHQLTHQPTLDPAQQLTLDPAHQLTLDPAHQLTLDPAHSIHQLTLNPAHHLDLYPGNQLNPHHDHKPTFVGTPASWAGWGGLWFGLSSWVASKAFEHDYLNLDTSQHQNSHPGHDQSLNSNPNDVISVDPGLVPSLTSDQVAHVLSIDPSLSHFVSGHGHNQGASALGIDPSLSLHHGFDTTGAWDGGGSHASGGWR